ncbi:MAG: sigma-70 family RNA polymerase sigma factor [Phycisphaerae bacterium]
MEFPDRSLVEGLRAGKRQAFKEVYDLYKSDVLALATVMLGRRDGALDLLHDLFIALARNAAQLAPDSNLKGYLLTAAANRARDCLTKRDPLKNQIEPTNDIPCPSAENPLQTMAKKEESDRLKTAVTTLPDEQRLVVALHVYGELSFREIAVREGISENTAQSRYRYALEKLQNHFSKEVNDERQ